MKFLHLFSLAVIGSQAIKISLKQEEDDEADRESPVDFIFRHTDANGDGQITWEEAEDAFDNKFVPAAK